MVGKILITGAFGTVGSALLALPAEKVLFDLAVPDEYQHRPDVVIGTILDGKLLENAMRGCDAVVHLAAKASPESSWSEVLEANIRGTQTVLETARNTGVEKVIFASSNHVVGMVEIEKTPWIYEPGHGIMLTKDAEPRPDSYYGVSKLLGENLGRYFAENGGPRFYALRIGAVLKNGYEYAYAYADEDVRKGKYEKGSKAYIENGKRLRAIWLSRDDLVQLIRLCLDYAGPAFDVFYGVSDNPAGWLDIDYAKRQLGYRPMHSGADLPLEKALA